MDFVTFEIAKLLREKGYPQSRQNAFAIYNEEGEWYSLARSLDTFDFTFGFNDGVYVCPTTEQVMNWLRDHKKLHINISYTYLRTPTWRYEVQKIDDFGLWFSEESFQSYKEAVSAGIKYIIDNMI